MRRLSSAVPSLRELASGVRFVGALPAFLHHPLSTEQARAILRRRWERRDVNFLATVRAVLAAPNNPYQRLLAAAGCQYGDVEKLVHNQGLVGTLEALLRVGVYLTVDELKGRRPAVRGSTTVAVNSALLRAPSAAGHYRVQSSGTSGAATGLDIDLSAIRDVGVDFHLEYAARGGLDWEMGHCSVPGGSALNGILQHAAAGTPIRRWFCPVSPSAPNLPPRYEWSAQALRWGGRLAGVPMPVPENLSMSGPDALLEWLHVTLRRGRTPHVRLAPSLAVKICEMAEERGVDIVGAQFMLGGEPLTPARRELVERAGVRVSPMYATVETGRLGCGCLAPEAPDELHLHEDTFVFVQPGAAAPAASGFPPRALLVSTLSPFARLPLLNASLGDEGTLVRRACGCPMEQLGWTTHLNEVRSFDKLTSGGMTFLDSHVVRALEEALPARFGGVPTDYQLLEDEASDGSPRVRLLVHPRLGELDDEVIVRTFLDAISAGPGAEPVMGAMWSDAGLVQVERRAPEATQSGKIHHFRSAGTTGV